MTKNKKKNLRGSTGPKTPEGKANSSQNRTTHGCRSKKVVILEGETQEDYDALREGWLTDFGPENFAVKRLVERLILNDWLVERASRWLLRAQEEMAEGDDPMRWDPERLHRLDLMLRYQTTAERAFYRSWQAAQNLRKDIARDTAQRADKAAKSEARTEQAEEETIDDDELTVSRAEIETMSKVPTVEQWVEVRVQNDKTISQVRPSNERVAEQAREMIPPAEDVVRRFLFWTRVPKEYHWATEDSTIRAEGGAVAFRMSMQEWRELVERENAGRE